MKTLLAFLIPFVAVSVRAASPSFQDFNANQFGTTGNKVVIKSGVLLTNPIVALGTITGNGQGLSNVVHTSGVNVVADGWLVGDGLQSSFESTGGGLYYAATGHVFTGAMTGDGSGLSNLTASASLQTPWLQDIDGAGFSLHNFSSLITTNSGGMAFGILTDGAGQLQSSPGGVVFGKVDTGIISAEVGLAGGDTSGTADGEITALGDGSVAIGNVDSDGGRIHADEHGSIAFGFVDDGLVQATEAGGGAFGNVGSGELSSMAQGAFAFGKVSEGIITATGDGSFATGDSGDGNIEAGSSGSFVHGKADSSTGDISTSGDGAFAGGYAGDGTISASGLGSFAHGEADSGGTIEATSDGAFAGGSADDSAASISASADGAIAYGVAPLTASGAASIALGQNSQATHANSAVINLDPATATGSSAVGTFTVRAPGGINLLGGPITGNGVSLTNVLEKNIVSTTNLWSDLVATFGSDRLSLRDMAGNLTISGVAGFVTSNLNWMTFSLNPNGATRVVNVPVDWFVSGFTNATTASITNGTWAFLDVRMVVNKFTNATLTIFQ